MDSAPSQPARRAPDDTVSGPPAVLPPGAAAPAAGKPPVAAAAAAVIAGAEAAFVSCTERYPMLRALGAGGMGEVYLARHPVTGVEVAVKRLKAHLLTDPDAVKRFVAEARHMFHMNHPRIVRVLDVDDPPGGPFYTMPYMAAGSLAAMLRAGEPADEAFTLQVARDVAEALAYAHRKGIIHRDLKPANVLMDADGHACLSDFGLVRDLRTNDSIRDSGEIFCEGTAPYMSPAVARGEVEDTRCDIYGFGAMLYELLAGRAPYPCDDLRTMRQTLKLVRAGPPPRIRRRNPKAPARLTAIAEACMARELRDRYARMADVLGDLERVAAGLAPLGPHGTGGRHRRQLWPLMAAVASVLLSAAIVAWRWDPAWSFRHAGHAVPLLATAPAGEPRTTDLLAGLQAKRDLLPIGAALTAAGGLDLEANPDSGTEPSVAVVLAEAPAGDYDLRLTFTRLSGDDGLDHTLVRRNPSAAFCWTVGGFNDSVAGFWRVDGADLSDDNRTTRRNDQGWLGVGVKHTTELRVRADSVTALLDGAVTYTHQTDYSDLKFPRPGDMSEPLKGRIGVRVLRSHFLIHEARLIEWPAAAGQMRMTR